MRCGREIRLSADLRIVHAADFFAAEELLSQAGCPLEIQGEESAARIAQHNLRSRSEADDDTRAQEVQCLEFCRERRTAVHC